MLQRASKGMKHTYGQIMMLVKKSVEMVNPQIFHIEDIVEAQVSFIAVPLKDNKHKIIVVLQLIALLDATFSQASYLLHM